MEEEWIFYNAAKNKDRYNPRDIRRDEGIRKMYTSIVSARYTQSDWQAYNEAKNSCNGDAGKWERLKQQNPLYARMASDYRKAAEAAEAHLKMLENRTNPDDGKSGV